MNGTAQAVADYAAAWADPPAGIDIVLWPPWAYLDRLASALRGRGVRFGVQNTAVESAGAITGEQVAEMARDLGAEFAIVGHSERRRPTAKPTRSLSPSCWPPKGRASHQLSASVRHSRNGVAETPPPSYSPNSTPSTRMPDRRLGKRRDRLRTGVGNRDRRNRHTDPSPRNARRHPRIREYLSGRSSELAETTRILYGGSVNATNAEDLFVQADIDGGLVAWSAAHHSTPGSFPGFAAQSARYPVVNNLLQSRNTAEGRGALRPECGFSEVLTSLLDPPPVRVGARAA